MSDDPKLQGELGRMAALVQPALREMSSNDRIEFMTFLRAVVSAYCPTCGEAFADGCVCTR